MWRRSRRRRLGAVEDADVYLLAALAVAGQAADEEEVRPLLQVEDILPGVEGADRVIGVAMPERLMGHLQHVLRLSPVVEHYHTNYLSIF